MEEPISNMCEFRAGQGTLYGIVRANVLSRLCGCDSALLCVDLDTFKPRIWAIRLQVQSFHDQHHRPEGYLRNFVAAVPCSIDEKLRPVDNTILRKLLVDLSSLVAKRTLYTPRVGMRSHGPYPLNSSEFYVLGE